jgi:hypothetical protein
MNGFAKTLLLVLLGCISVLAAGQAVFESVFAKQEVPLELDPALPFCSAARPVNMEKDSFWKGCPSISHGGVARESYFFPESNSAA